MRRLPLLAVALLTVPACRQTDAHAADAENAMAHMNHAGSSATIATAQDDTTLPPDAAHALARLNASPRHGEYVTIPAGKDSIRAWVVYPSRSTKAPVVLVVHEIFGLSTWVRAIADQLAAAGYIAIAPDLLTNQHIATAPDSISMQDGIAAVSKLNPDDVQRWLDASASYGMALPAALPKYGIVGFCWGGGTTLQHAAHAGSKVSAVVEYYGPAGSATSLTSIAAPVLGFYGGNDARVVMTIPSVDSAMHAPGKTFTHSVYDGATHGFLRDQGGASGANLAATRQAWPSTIRWFQKYLGA